PEEADREVQPARQHARRAPPLGGRRDQAAGDVDQGRRPDRHGPPGDGPRRPRLQGGAEGHGGIEGRQGDAPRHRREGSGVGRQRLHRSGQAEGGLHAGGGVPPGFGDRRSGQGDAAGRQVVAAGLPEVTDYFFRTPWTAATTSLSRGNSPFFLSATLVEPTQTVNSPLSPSISVAETPSFFFSSAATRTAWGL